ncbi:MAG: hypothetical protein A4E42_00681 [Methanoregulaceae archaeon PtaU1.Bin222]|nr:MAG: hypothetical protein A4E42_00681 [Methanoregulaceae archaeon PtaU1.Bin222]
MVTPLVSTKWRVSRTIFWPLRIEFLCRVTSNVRAFSTPLYEVIFLISTRSLPWIEMFASTLSDPSFSLSKTPRYSRVALILFRNFLASLGERRSGSVTISMRGIPALL